MLLFVVIIAAVIVAITIAIVLSLQRQHHSETITTKGLQVDSHPSIYPYSKPSISTLVFIHLFIYQSMLGLFLYFIVTVCVVIAITITIVINDNNVVVFIVVCFVVAAIVTHRYYDDQHYYYDLIKACHKGSNTVVIICHHTRFDNKYKFIRDVKNLNPGYPRGH